MALIVITPPATADVSELRAQMRLELAGSPEVQAGLIDEMLAAALAEVEANLGRTMLTQTLELVLDAFPTGAVEIPLPPLQSVTSVKYLASDGVSTTLVVDTDYAVDTASQPGWVLPPDGVSWPTTFAGINAVRIRFVAGYGTAANIPANVRQWLRERVALRYDNREAPPAPDFGLLAGLRLRWPMA